MATTITFQISRGGDSAIKEIAIPALDGEKNYSNPFSGGIVTKIAILKDSNGIQLSRETAEITIDVTGGIKVKPGIIVDLTNLTLICFGR